MRCVLSEVRACQYSAARTLNPHGGRRTGDGGRGTGAVIRRQSSVLGQRARQPFAAEKVQPLPQVGQRGDQDRRNPHCQRDGGQLVHAGVTPVADVQPEGVEHWHLDQQCQQGEDQQRLGIGPLPGQVDPQGERQRRDGTL